MMGYIPYIYQALLTLIYTGCLMPDGLCVCVCVCVLVCLVSDDQIIYGHVFDIHGIIMDWVRIC